MHLSKLRSSVVSVSNLRRLYDVLNAYDPYDVATAVYVIAVQFADYATACEAFAAGSTTLDDDVARAFECGLDAVDGDGSEPFSLAYAGVTSGGRRALHEAGNSQLCDRAFRQLAALGAEVRYCEFASVGAIAEAAAKVGQFFSRGSPACAVTGRRRLARRRSCWQRWRPFAPSRMGPSPGRGQRRGGPPWQPTCRSRTPTSTASLRAHLAFPPPASVLHLAGIQLSDVEPGLAVILTGEGVLNEDGFTKRTVKRWLQDNGIHVDKEPRKGTAARPGTRFRVQLPISTAAAPLLNKPMAIHPRVLVIKRPATPGKITGTRDDVTGRWSPTHPLPAGIRVAAWRQPDRPDRGGQHEFARQRVGTTHTARFSPGRSYAGSVERRDGRRDAEFSTRDAVEDHGAGCGDGLTAGTSRASSIAHILRVVSKQAGPLCCARTVCQHISPRVCAPRAVQRSHVRASTRFAYTRFHTFLCAEVVQSATGRQTF